MGLKLNRLLTALATTTILGLTARAASAKDLIAIFMPSPDNPFFKSEAVAA